MGKKTRKSIKPRKLEKNNWKNRTEKKNRLNRLNFWKNRPVRFGFGFINKKPKNRTEPKPTKNRKKNRAKPRKPSQNWKNRAKPVWTGFFPKKPNRTETGRYEPVSVRFQFFFKKKKSIWLLFLIKTEPKMITSTSNYISKLCFYFSIQP